MMKELVPDRRVIPGLEWMEEGTSPRLRPDSLVYVGLRDIDKVSIQIFILKTRTSSFVDEIFRLELILGREEVH